MSCPVCGSDSCTCAEQLYDGFMGGGPPDVPAEYQPHHVPPAEGDYEVDGVEEQS